MERADSRCLTPVQTESVADQRVALWKGTPEPEEVSLKATQTIVIAILSVAAVMAVSRWIFGRISVGDYLPAQIFAIAVMISPLAIFAIILFQKRHRLHRNERMVPSCVELPRAVPVRASLSTGQATRGSSMGWLSISEGLLTFHGEYFDFALRPDDFKKSKDLLGQLTNQGAVIQTPDGVSTQLMRLKFLAKEDDVWVVDSTGKERFSRDFEAWWQSRPTRPSLFPPLRYSGTPVRLQGLFLGFGGIGLLLGIVIWQLPAILGTALFEGRSTLGMGVAIFVFMQLIPVQLALVANGSKPFDREVEKVLERERKGMEIGSE